MRKLLLCLGLLAISLPGQAEPYQVPHTTNLYADGQLARERNLPLLILFSMDECTYCEIVREQFLEPMLRSGDYTDKVIMRMVKVDEYAPIRDFDGQRREPAAISRRYRASLTPTVIFVDHRGHELAPRLLGVTNVYYYGGDLDKSIELSLSRLRPVQLSRQP